MHNFVDIHVSEHAWAVYVHMCELMYVYKCVSIVCVGTHKCVHRCEWNCMGIMCTCVCARMCVHAHKSICLCL